MAGVSSVKLFVGNLPFSATNNTLETFFSPFGELIGVKLVEDRSTHRPRGFGFVTFKESAAADRALMANGRELEGRVLTIRRAVARGTGSLKGEGGSDDDDNHNSNEMDGSSGNNAPVRGGLLAITGSCNGKRLSHSMNNWTGPGDGVGGRGRSGRLGGNRGGRGGQSSNTEKAIGGGDLRSGANDPVRPGAAAASAAERLVFFRNKVKTDGRPSAQQLAAFLRSVVVALRKAATLGDPDWDMRSLGWDFASNRGLPEVREPPSVDAVILWLKETAGKGGSKETQGKAATAGSTERRESDRDGDEEEPADFQSRLDKPMAELLEEYGAYDPNWRDVNPTKEHAKEGPEQSAAQQEQQPAAGN